MRITGKDRNQTKEYLYDVFQSALSELIDFDNETREYFVPAWSESAKRFPESIVV